jgi:arsenate reductase
LVITVCDSAAAESCPLWPGAPLQVHWGFADPSHNAGSDAEKRLAFAHTCELIAVKINQLVALPIEHLMQPENKAALHAALLQIGSIN